MMSSSTNDYSLETLSEASHYNEWIYDLMRPFLGRHVLEFGAGIGNHTPNLLRDGRTVVSIDIDQELIRRHRERVPVNPRLTVLCTGIQDLAGNRYYERAFDSVVSSNVLEHIPDVVDREVVRAMYRVLRQGGHAVHWIPACQMIFGTMDTTFGHYRRYNRTSATALFTDAGFEIVSCEFWNLPGFFSWWASGRLLKTKSIPRSSALAFDRLVVPIIRRIEPWIWRPFGQSLLVVAQKRTQ
ncbi:MAG: class I SAM-dependent methyltransferase [Bacteroidota bacterium]